MCIAMTFEGALRNIFATGREDDTIVHIPCPPLFSMRSVVATRETLWRLCGYGVSPVDRYLDATMTWYINIILVYIYSDLVIETN